MHSARKAVTFKGIGGASKVQLLPAPWPAESLPPPTASLLGVASGKGLVAAAGPDAVILAKSSAVREAASNKTEGKVSPIQPEIKLAVPRVSQLALSADENVLVISAENGGGLAAYQVDNVMKGETSPALQLQTNGSALRALVPNPDQASEKAALFAAVTVSGDLLVADLRNAILLNGSSGSVLKSGVSCVSWSNRGKQLVAGLADGSACQMTPNGEIKATIPRPPSLADGTHMSTICWLEDNVFLAFYSENEGVTADAYIIQREKNTSNFETQKLPEVVGPLGLERTPAVNFVGRLRKFPPSLTDLILVASTCGLDIGLISKSEKPLSDQHANTSGVYATTAITKDHGKAILPFDGGDTSPIGLAIDLSSDKIILQPLESHEELAASDSPVPNLFVLNNEGVLCIWNIVYADSILQKTPYPLLTAVGETSKQQSQIQSPSSPPVALSSSDPPTFGQTAFGQPTQPFTLGQPAQQSSFGQAAQSPGFGQTAFGQPKSAFGTSGFASTPGTSFSSKPVGSTPSWVSTGMNDNTTRQNQSSAFGQSGFGTASPLGASASKPTSAFGASPFGGGGATTFGSPAFGKPAIPGPQSQNNSSDTSQSAFGQSKPQPSGSGSGGFSSFSGGSGFSAFNTSKFGESPFANKASSGSPFGQPSAQRNFSSMDMDTGSAFGTPENKESDKKGAFSTSSGGFNLGSAFKATAQPDNDSSKPSTNSGLGFGKGFGDLLGETTKANVQTQSRDESMGEAEESAPSTDSATSAQPKESAGLEAQIATTTPPSTIIHKKPSTTPALGGLFDKQPSTNATPAPPAASQPTWTFGQDPSTTPKDPPKQMNFSTTPPTAPKIKTESPSDDGTHTPLHQVPEAPLPPDSTSKTSYTPGNTSTSSTGSQKSSSVDDAPLPPDFTKANKNVPADAPLPPDWKPSVKTSVDDAPLPPVFAKPSKSASESTSETPKPVVSAASEASADLSRDNTFSTVDSHNEPLPEASDDPDSAWEDGSEDESQEAQPDDSPESLARTDDVTGEHTEDLRTSPESSFGKDDDTTGGPFTKITQQPNRPNQLFGEVSKGAPIFLPPKKAPESPRSPSPQRSILPLNDSLRPETSRSVSAPTRPHAAISNRRAELKNHAVPQQAPRSIAQIHAEEQQRSQSKPQATQYQGAPALGDDEDEQLRAELARPVSPSENLDAFLPHQPPADKLNGSGISAQIERLYHDINSMIGTLGLNVRSLSAFLLYQGKSQSQDHRDHDSWQDLLASDDHAAILGGTWTFSDIEKLYLGENVLDEMLQDVKIEKTSSLLDACQVLLGKELDQFQRKLISLRKAFNSVATAESAASAPLSVEQSTLQQTLRKGSTSVETKLAEVEQSISILRAKVAESRPSNNNGFQKTKKPTVEGVTKTIQKMTSMAERKSSDIVVLEAQLRKLNLDLDTSVNGSRAGSSEPETMTPYRSRPRLGDSPLRKDPITPGSIYHTPASKFSASAMSAKGSFKASNSGLKSLAAMGDKEQWYEKTKRKEAVNALLKEALLARRS
ncbi:MAG: hypothetical protein Q9227_007990 [Pyrenula ochraceoflavens]